MIISHNLAAMNANRQFNIVTDKRKKTMERLGSGYRINRAADDAAGLAISEKMRRQIRGLTQGVQNTQDGVSMCQIADGALEEVSDILHRITELSVKSANDTNTAEDREYIQKEVQQLIKEIDRVSETTTFNEIPILSIGPLPESVRASSIKESDLSNDAIVNKLLNATFPDIVGDIKIDDATALSSDVANGMLRALSNYVITNEVYTKGYSFPEDKVAIEPLYMRAHKNVEYFVDFASDPYMGQFFLDRAKSFAEEGFRIDYKDDFGGAYTQYNYASFQAGVDCAYSMEHFADYLKYGGTYIDASMRGFAEDVKLELKYRGNVDGGTLYNMAESMYPGNSNFYNKNGVAANIYRYLFENEITDEDNKGIWIQSGTEVGSGINVEINKIDATILGVKSVDVSTKTGAENAMDATHKAISILNESRAKIGAQQNRLEHTIANENNVIENTTAAESRVRDTDMSKEIVQNSMQDILSQAGIAMMSQANQSNQGVLSLLQ